MENSGILNKRKWATVRKAQLIGAVIGITVTVLVHMLARSFGHGENGVGWLLMLPYFVIIFPTGLLYTTLGLEWKVGDIYDVTLSKFCVMIVVNMILFLLLGGVVGFLTKRYRERKCKNTPNQQV